MITVYEMPVDWHDACSQYRANPPAEAVLQSNGNQPMDTCLSAFLDVDNDFLVIRDWLSDQDFEFNMYGRFEVETFPCRESETRLSGMTFEFTNDRDCRLFKSFWSKPTYHC